MIYSLKKHLLARNKAACVRVFSTTNSQSPIFTLTLTFIFTFVHMAWFASPPHLWRIKMQKRVCSWKNCKAPLRYFRFFFLFSISNCGCGLNCQLLRRAACFMNLHIFTIFRASVPRRLCVRFNHLIREPLNWLWLWWIMQTIDVRCAMCECCRKWASGGRVRVLSLLFSGAWQGNWKVEFFQYAKRILIKNGIN